VSTRFAVCVLLSSLGVDSVAAAVKFMEEVSMGKVICNRIILVANKTPLSHPELEYYAGLLAKRLGVEYKVLKPVCYAYSPPTCRFCWKTNPLARFLRSLPSYPSRYILLVTGQRRSESSVRAKLGEWGSMYGVVVYRPVYNYFKTACWNVSSRVMPELVPVWKEIARKNGGHTSLDCTQCLRILKKKNGLRSNK